MGPLQGAAPRGSSVGPCARLRCPSSISPGRGGREACGELVRPGFQLFDGDKQSPTGRLPPGRAVTIRTWPIGSADRGSPSASGDHEVPDGSKKPCQVSGPSSQACRHLGDTPIWRIPPPLPGYPMWVFVHQGTLHRNSGTKSRTTALAAVATLKRRDCLSMGAILEPVSLGQGLRWRLESGTRRGEWTEPQSVASVHSLPLSGADFSGARWPGETVEHRVIRIGVWAEVTRSAH